MSRKRKRRVETNVAIDPKMFDMACELGITLRDRMTSAGMSLEDAQLVSAICLADAALTLFFLSYMERTAPSVQGVASDNMFDCLELAKKRLIHGLANRQEWTEILTIATHPWN